MSEIDYSNGRNMALVGVLRHCLRELGEENMAVVGGARLVAERAQTVADRWFLDTEFHEDGRTIDLISIALVSGDGREYYAVSSEFDLGRAQQNEWLAKNVLPHLPPRETWKPRVVIAGEIRTLLLHAGKPEIWAYFADYDWVALCQLYGRMIDLPDGFPFFCMDLKQLLVARGIQKSALPRQAGAEHDALADAQWVRDAWLWIQRREKR